MVKSEKSSLNHYCLHTLETGFLVTQLICDTPSNIYGTLVLVAYYKAIREGSEKTVQMAIIKLNWSALLVH